MTRLRVFVLPLSLMVLSTSPAWSQSSDLKANPCPPLATTGSAEQAGRAGNSAENPAGEQGIEHSAILPDAGGAEDSAAPTVKKDGQEVTANTECPKLPNRLEDSRRPGG